jgi:23S rRNA (uracil1939-C5)-methyltransferase
MSDPIIEITTLTYGGDGLGRLVLPGEQVRVRLVEEKLRHTRGELIKIVQASSARIKPHCSHFRDCGGCHYQHMPYQLQLEVKRKVLEDQLIRIGKMEAPVVHPTVASPEIWNYRNSVQFHLSGKGKLGYLAADTHRLVEIRECHLLEALLDETWRQLEFEADSGITSVELRAGAAEDVLLMLQGDGEVPPELTIEQRLSAVYTGGGNHFVLAGDDFMLMQVETEVFKVSAQSFFPVNTSQAWAMVRHVLERLSLQSDQTVLDVFSGVGLFSKFLARQAGRVIAIEVNPWACEDFADNLDEFENVELYIGAVEKVLPDIKEPVQAAIMVPPRTGVQHLALDALCSLHPVSILYVSLDPSTLGRDARHLTEAGYRLIETKPFDLFPQTYHIESISLFSM